MRDSGYTVGVGRYYLLLDEVQEVAGWEKAVNSLLEKGNNRVVKFVIENVGKTFSANAIVKFLKSEGRALSVESI